jgi:5-formyltetrahydrofolate cyclo-ligase
MRVRRRGLSESERAAHAERLARVLCTALLPKRVRRFACYLARDGEPDLGPFVSRLWRCRRESYLPVLHARKLWFLPYRADTPLVANRFGIPEPASSARERCAPRALDFVLMPLVAFDESGNRLGMGGGFYDRTFADGARGRTWRKPWLIGIAYEFQRVPSLPVQAWDVPLDGIATERGVRLFTGRGGNRANRAAPSADRGEAT